MLKPLDLLNRISRPNVLIGIDKGRHSLKIAIARRNPQGLELEDFLVESLVGIEEEKRDSFSRDKLFSVLRDKNISKAGVFFTAFDNDAVFAKRLTLPSMPLREIKQALNWETKDSLPFSASQAIFDFQIVGETVKPDGKKSIDLIAMGIDRKNIREAVSFIEGTELSLENITVVPAALINIVGCLKEPQLATDEPIAFLELGYRHSTLCVFKEKKLIFTRNLFIGSEDITNSMMAEVSTDAGVINLSYEQAEKIKLEIGIPQKDQTVKVDGQIIKTTRLSSMMLPCLERLSKEIDKSFVYASEKMGQTKPKKMYLVGGGALLKNIDKFFSGQLNIDVKVFDLGKDQPFCANIPSEKKKELAQVIPVIGTVVGDENEITLLPFEFKKRKLEIAGKILTRMVVFAAFASLLMSYMIISYRQIDYKKRYKLMKRQQDVMFRLRKSKNEIEGTQSAFSTIKENRIATLMILQEISLRTPKDILLEDIDYAYGDEEIRIGGVVLSSELVAPTILSEYIKIIENSPIFQSANLIGSTQVSQEDTSVLEFTISCKLERPL